VADLRTITLYSLPDCPWCEAGRAFLRESGYPFVERCLHTDPTALPDMLFIVGRPDVPVLSVGYQAVVGFDPEAWHEAIREAMKMEGDPFELPAELGPDPYQD
jgi:glutaredoxin